MQSRHRFSRRDHAAAKSSAVTAAVTAAATGNPTVISLLTNSSFDVVTRPPPLVGARSRRGCGQRTVRVDRGDRGSKAAREAYGHGLSFASVGVSRLRGLGVGLGVTHSLGYEWFDVRDETRRRSGSGARWAFMLRQRMVQRVTYGSWSQTTVPFE